MAIEGLTKEQSDFVERFLTVPPSAERERKKELKNAAKAEYRTFHAEASLVREEIATIGDPTVQSELLTRLSAAEATIEAAPENLDFDAGHAVLDAVRAEASAAVTKAQANGLFEALAPRMSEMGAPDTPLKKDIAALWGIAGAARESGDVQGQREALAAMRRMEPMLASAKKEEENPFLGGNDDRPEAERATLARAHDALAVLRSELAARFGADAIPMALLIELSAAQNGLDAARTASADDIAALVGDIEAKVKTAQDKAVAFIDRARPWEDEHDAFLARYQVMLEHPKRSDTSFVKPLFDEVTAAYRSATSLADAHEFDAAREKLGAARNLLADALDLADDFAAYHDLHLARAALVKRLPEPAGYRLDRLRDEHEDAVGLLSQAETLYAAKQVSGAVSLLNQIPDAVAELLRDHKLATAFETQKAAWERRSAEMSGGAAPEAFAFVADDLASAAEAVAAAEADAERGALQSAVGQMRPVIGGLPEIRRRLETAKTYLDAREAFAGRLAETRARQGAGGGVAIAGYLQELLADDAKRAAAEATLDAAEALQHCQAHAAEHDGMMGLADQAERYLQEKAGFDAALAALKGVSGTQAKEVRSEAQHALAQAVAATARDSWLIATTIIQAARLDLDRASGDVETDALIAAQDDAALSGPDDADAAFRKVHDHVAAQDVSGLFADKLDAADAQAGSVADLAASDLPAAQKTLDAAMAACRDVARLVGAARAYEARRVPTIDAVNAVSDRNRDEIISADLLAIQQDLDAASDVAAGPAPDFDKATSFLTAAREKCRAAEETAALYSETVQPALARLDAASTRAAAPQDAPFFAGLSDDLRTARAALTAALEARDLSGAASLASEAADLARRTESALASHAAAEAFIDANLGGDGEEALAHPAAATEAARAAELTARMAGLRAAGDYDGLLDVAEDLHRTRMQAKAKAGGFDLYLEAKIPAARALAALEERALPDTGAVLDAVTDLRARFDRAEAIGGAGNFTGAARVLETVTADYDAAAAGLDLYDRHLVLRERAEAALERLRGQDTSAIASLLSALEAANTTAARRAASADYAGAIAIDTDLIRDCAAADAALARRAATEENTGEPGPDATPEAIVAAVAAAETRLNEIARKPSALFLRAETAQAREALTAAQAVSDDTAKAGQALQQVQEQLSGLEVRLLQFDALTALADRVAQQGQRLQDAHPIRKTAGDSDYASAEIAQRLDAIARAVAPDALTADTRADAQGIVQEARDAFDALGRDMDAQIVFGRRRDAAAQRLALFDKNPLRHHFGNDLAAARKALEAAGRSADNRDHASAAASLAQAEAFLDAAHLRAQLADQETPDAASLAALLERPDGAETFEKIAADLQEPAKSALIARAMETRFGVAVDTDTGTETDEDGDDMANVMPGIDISKVFDTLSDAPLSDAEQNENMLTFFGIEAADRAESDTISGKREVARERRSRRKPKYDKALDIELGLVDEAAMPEPGEERTKRSWNTLRELGYAINARMGYMDKHGERLAGWKVYGSDVGEVAQIIAKEYDFDADYVAAYMSGFAGQTLPIPEPVGCGWDDWESRMTECRQFVDRARAGNKPWAAAALADACAIGRHTYVESGEGNWARYRTAERKIGVSGLQFRSPGDWFAELYAAYQTGRLKENHPHRWDIEEL